ncbi:MAG TPA: Uma2 family endonuclease [Gemmatimonadaceae bacterium]|jgi:Uma2 family endonuclease|nr:Uma2 family endonuclease [Gemmatimonadaceae bacterium]
MPNLKRQWTVADRDELPDDGNRYEVIDGELFVTPAPAWRHQDAVGRLYRALSEDLDRQRIGAAFIAPADVVFSPRRGVQPDLFVVPLVDGRRPRHFDEVNRLLLAVEVLSPSTARADRVVKRMLYRDEHVDEYWIVDLDSRIIERSTPSEARPELVDGRLEWLPVGSENPFAPDLIDYFARVLDDRP